MATTGPSTRDLFPHTCQSAGFMPNPCGSCQANAPGGCNRRREVTELVNSPAGKRRKKLLKSKKVKERALRLALSKPRTSRSRRSRGLINYTTSTDDAVLSDKEYRPKKRTKNPTAPATIGSSVSMKKRLHRVSTKKRLHRVNCSRNYFQNRAMGHKATKQQLLQAGEALKQSL